MISVKTNAYIGRDGTLKVEVPTPLHETDAEVLLIIEPLPAHRPSTMNIHSFEERGEPQGE